MPDQDERGKAIMSDKLRKFFIGVSFCLVRISAPVDAYWTPMIVDDDAGTFASLAIVDGHPAISYYDAANGDLKYVRATNVSGSIWGSPVMVDSIGNVGQYTSLALVNGNPAIAYLDADNLDLRYIRATDAVGSAWGAFIALDVASSGGQYASLIVVNGYPAIAYHGASFNRLKYIRATDPLGTAWGMPILLDSESGSVGQYASMAVVNGHPAISYYNNSPNFQLKYVRATDPDGTGWDTAVAVEPGVTGGTHTSLAVINGNPSISYHGGGNLKYIRSTDANGAAWGAPVAVDTPGTVGEYSSLALVNGSPAISYYDSTNANLKFVRATNDTGALLGDWGTPVGVDSTGNVGHTPRWWL